MLLALGHPFCMHALLACCGAEMPTGVGNHRQLARFHYTHAVAGLRNALNDQHLEHRWVVAMLTIMMLCIYEVGFQSGAMVQACLYLSRALFLSDCRLSSAPNRPDRPGWRFTWQGQQG